jgi:hypothetical protein
MPKKKWTTKEQEDWLSERIPAFVQAQQEKTTAGFFPPVYESWYKEFPSAEPTPDDIAAAGSDIAKAEALVKKKEREVSIFLVFVAHFFNARHLHISSAYIGGFTITRVPLHLGPTREICSNSRAKHKRSSHSRHIHGYITKLN